MKKYLFICGKNQLRSPTAENIFSNIEGLEVRSAGINEDAEYKVTIEDMDWADIIFVMEKKQKEKLVKKFNRFLKGKKVAVLDIPDEYGYMDEKLITLLKDKMKKWIDLI